MEQMSRAHDLSNVIPSLTIKGQMLKRVRTFKLLGTWLNENLKWTDHIKELVSPCHKVLSILRKIRNRDPQQVKKAISGNFKVSSLLSWTYNNTVCYHNCPGILTEETSTGSNRGCKLCEEPLLHRARHP